MMHDSYNIRMARERRKAERRAFLADLFTFGAIVVAIAIAFAVLMKSRADIAANDDALLAGRMEVAVVETQGLIEDVIREIAASSQGRGDRERAAEMRKRGERIAEDVTMIKAEIAARGSEVAK